MKLVSIIEFILRRKRGFTWLFLGGLLLLNLVDILPFVVDKQHAHTAAERIPGFWSVFGFVGCILLIVLSKWFGHCGIMTREDYYDE